jgi:hypothetical protein
MDRRRSLFRFAETMALPESSWFSLRVNRGSMQTSPVYVLRGNEPIRQRAAVEALLETVRSFETKAGRKLSRKDRSRVDQAKAAYEKLLRR